MELKQYWKIIRRKIWLIGLLVLISAAATGIYSHFFIVKQYTASTKLIVNQNQDLSVINGKLDLGTINSNIQLIKTYKEIIRSPRIMNLVAERYPELGLSSNQLIGRVGVTAVNESQVMSVFAIDTSYSRAANIVNAVADVFQKEIPTLMKVDNVSILNAVNPNDRALPVSPNANMNILISIILSLLIGVGFVLLLEYMDDTVKSEEEVRELLDIATLSQIPRVKGKGKHAGRKKGYQDYTLRGEKNVTIQA